MRNEFKTILIFKWAILFLAGLGQSAEYPSDGLSGLWRRCPNPQTEGNIYINWGNIWQSGFFAQSTGNPQETNLYYSHNSLKYKEIDYNLWQASNIASDADSPAYPLILDMSDWVYYGKKSDMAALEPQIITVKTGYYWGYPYWNEYYRYWHRGTIEPFFEERTWYPSSPAYPLYNEHGNGLYMYPMRYVEVKINLDMDLSFHTGAFTSD